jgi:hypothetical protein
MVDPESGQFIKIPVEQQRQMMTQAYQGLINHKTQMDLNYMEQIAKFPNNPHIQNLGAQVLARTNQWQKEIMGAAGEVYGREQAVADIDKTRAQTEAFSAEAAAAKTKATKDVLFKGIFPQKVMADRTPMDPMGVRNIDNWLFTSKEGKEHIAAFLDAYEADITSALHKADPTLKFSFGKGDTRLVDAVKKHAPEIYDKAVGALLRRVFPEEEWELLPDKFDRYVEAGEEKPEPTITERIPKAALREQFRTVNPETGKSMAEDAFERFGTFIATQADPKGKYKNIEAAIRDFAKQEGDEFVEQNVADFPGAKTVRDNLEAEIVDYLKENWQRHPQTVEDFGVPKEKTVHEKGAEKVQSLLGRVGPTATAQQRVQQEGFMGPQGTVGQPPGQVMFPSPTGGPMVPANPITAPQPRNVQQRLLGGETAQAQYVPLQPTPEKPTAAQKRYGKYDTLINQHAEQHNIPAPLVKAVIYIESRMNPNAVSEKGATGLMQLMPTTAKGLGVANRKNPE